MLNMTKEEILIRSIINLEKMGRRDFHMLAYVVEIAGEKMFDEKKQTVTEDIHVTKDIYAKAGIRLKKSEKAACR